MSVQQDRLLLVVSRSLGNLRLLAETLQQAGYRTAEAASLEELDQKLASTQGQMALALVDVAGFDRRIWPRLEQLRRHGIPFIVIAPGGAPTVPTAGTAAGASAVLVKPVARRALVEMVRQLLRDSQH